MAVMVAALSEVGSENAIRAEARAEHAILRWRIERGESHRRRRIECREAGEADRARRHAGRRILRRDALRARWRPEVLGAGPSRPGQQTRGNEQLLHGLIILLRKPEMTNHK